jgi:anti-sigma regulatory factor (Ser/Thr protein kinase)
VDEFTPGDTIVLYTDGLVERRADGIAPGLDALLEASEERGDGSPASLVDRILTRLLEDQAHEDDVCLLAVARTAPVLRFSYALAASPAAVVEMRHAFADWLDDVELDPVRRRDAILAVSEAAANAAEHAYGFDHIGITRVECWITDDRLNVSVRDEGTWREPSTQTDRGRGHTIMEALMEDVCVEYRRRGTVVRMSVPLHEEVVQEEVVA